MRNRLPLPSFADAWRSLDSNCVWYPIIHSLQFPSPASMHTPHQPSADTAAVCGRTSSSFLFPGVVMTRKQGDVRKIGIHLGSDTFPFLVTN